MEEKKLNSKQQLIQLIGESVLDSLQKAGVSLTIPSEFEKLSSSSSRQNSQEADKLCQRIFEHRISLINELAKMFRDEPRRINRQMS